MFPETQPVIRELHEKGYKLACCSSSSPDYIDRALTDMEIKQYFDVIVSGHDFEHGKPAPDIYLYARDRFGLKSGECLVVEDSPIGIKAGKQAEMTVVARRDHVFGMDQSAADYHVDSLEELLPIVERL
jgi:HAD superfamily hydrolase (TIGR01509 family)